MILEQGCSACIKREQPWILSTKRLKIGDRKWQEEYFLVFIMIMILIVL